MHQWLEVSVVAGVEEDQSLEAQEMIDSRQRLQSRATRDREVQKRRELGKRREILNSEIVDHEPMKAGQVCHYASGGGIDPGDPQVLQPFHLSQLTEVLGLA